MSKIKKLSAHEAHKIAAGEVVERPANVVKELLENALDAGATQISLYVEDGGKKLIRVIDNGCGMSSEDAHLCFEHHATSKITTVDDLNSLITFGFRGEALSSIAAVSHVTLITKEATAHEGIKLELKHGTVVNESVIGAPTGTDITIEHLFDNVPARKKFLKQRETEWRHIHHLVQALCLDYPHIHFKLFSENKPIINCAPTPSLKERVAQLWEQELTGNLLEIAGEQPNNTITIKGVISDHQQFRYDRSGMLFFVNNRWIKNYTLSRALLKGYQNTLPQGRYPVAVVFITVDPGDVDINIHPRKEEVQFLHPIMVEKLLQNTVTQALEHAVSQHIRTTTHTAYNNALHAFPAPEQFTSQAQYITRTFTPQSTQEQFSVFTPPSLQPFSAAFSTYTQDIVPEQHTTPSAAPLHQSEQDINDFTLIGQYKKTYILLEKDQGLLVIDQHAAHERIVYEQFAHRFQDIATMRLMFPQIITLKKDDLDLLEPHFALLTDNGIGVTRAGTQQLTISSTPVHLKNCALDDLVHTIIAWLHEYTALDTHELFKVVNEKVHAQMACKAAVKAGDVLERSQMLQLINDLHTTDNRFACPHGRPTMWLLTIDELEKKFRRDYKK